MEQTNEYVIDGCVSVPENVTLDAFMGAFLAFCDANGYSFGGSIGPYAEEADNAQTTVISFEKGLTLIHPIDLTDLKP